MCVFVVYYYLMGDAEKLNGKGFHEGEQLSDEWDSFYSLGLLHRDTVA